LGAPVYKVVQTDGPPHERTFSVEAVWPSGHSSGQGSSIKSAEMMAARLALESLNGIDAEAKPKKPSSRKVTKK
jgi:dsRNA-specific ribonuclease